MSRSCAGLGLVASALLMMSACAAPISDGPAPPMATDPGIEHIYGLGVNPADGDLYAATHFGLCRLPDQRLPRPAVGSRSRLWPGFRAGRFLVSLDDGLTWDTRSSLDLYDFVVSPSDADVVRSTTARGVLPSNDGGGTWQPVVGCPAPSRSGLAQRWLTVRGNSRWHDPALR